LTNSYLLHKKELFIYKIMKEEYRYTLFCECNVEAPFKQRGKLLHESATYKSKSKSKSTICSGFCFFSHSFFHFPLFTVFHSEPLLFFSLSLNSLSILLEELLCNIL